MIWAPVRTFDSVPPDQVGPLSSGAEVVWVSLTSTSVKLSVPLSVRVGVVAVFGDGAGLIDGQHRGVVVAGDGDGHHLGVLELEPWPEFSVTVTVEGEGDGLAFAQELQQRVGDRVVPAVGVDREARGQRCDLGAVSGRSTACRPTRSDRSAAALRWCGMSLTSTSVKLSVPLSVRVGVVASSVDGAGRDRRSAPRARRCCPRW